MAAVGKVDLLNVRFPKCFHHGLFSPYIIVQNFVRTHFGECWFNIYSFFCLDVFILSLYIPLPLRFSIPVTQQGIMITDRGTCKLSDNGQFSRSINEQVVHGSRVYAEHLGFHMSQACALVLYSFCSRRSFMGEQCDSCIWEILIYCWHTF